MLLQPAALLRAPAPPVFGPPADLPEQPSAFAAAAAVPQCLEEQPAAHHACRSALRVLTIAALGGTQNGQLMHMDQHQIRQSTL